MFLAACRFVVAGCLAALLVGIAPAQKDKGEFLVPIPEKLERATEKDAQGLLQFVSHKAEKCVNCKGTQVMVCLHCARFDKGDCDSCPECKNTQEAKCRVCAGTGEMPDILQKAPCPTCFGAAITACFVCGGRGKFPVAGGGKKPQKCDCCDGVGAYACETCNGKRFVELPPMKPSLTDAKAADVEKAIAGVDAVAAEMAKFASTGDGRKDIKAFEKVTAAGSKPLPLLKRVQKHFESVSKRQSKGTTWVAYKDMVNNQAEATKHALEYWLKHQKRVLGLVLERAKHNEPLQAAQKK